MLTQIDQYFIFHIKMILDFVKIKKNCKAIVNYRKTFFFNYATTYSYVIFEIYLERNNFLWYSYKCHEKLFYTKNEVYERK